MNLRLDVQRPSSRECRAPSTGRPRAFEASLCALLPDLRRRARQLTRSAAAADDLVQDTLERALRFETSFEEGSHLRAWLMRILYNTFVSVQRRRAVEQKVLSRSSNDPNGWTRREHAVQVQPLPASVARAVLELPPRLRDALIIVDIDDGSYKDAASELNVPLGTVMSRLHRGRSRLADRLSDAELGRARARTGRSLQGKAA